MSSNLEFYTFDGDLIKSLIFNKMDESELTCRFEYGSWIYKESKFNIQMLLIKIHDLLLGTVHNIRIRNITKDDKEAAWLCERIANSTMASIILAEKSRFTRIEEKEKELQELKIGRYY